METTIMGLYWDNGKENGNYYNGMNAVALLQAACKVGFACP